MRPTTAAAPAAIAGSIALMLSAVPAQAADTPRLAIGMPQTPVFTGAAAALNVRAAAVAVPDTHVVQKGDSVWAIATRYGLRTADVLALNGLASSSIIRPGQVLRLTGGAPAPAPAPAAPTPGVLYVVARGDTLSGIAQRHGVALPDLFAANGLGWGSIIYPGQRIAIPGGAAPAPAPAPVPAAPAPAPAPPAAGTAYVIQKGDTIWAIANRNGLSTQAVLAANGLGSGSIIHPGQRITIPGAPAPAAAPAPAPAPAPVEQRSATLDAEQTANAQLIIRIGRELGVSDRGIAIALGAAMQEASLHNADYGDRDSRGLFQQRPSTGWGTVEEVLDPVRATKAFFGGPSDPNGTRTRGLLDIPGWESMTFTQAAQAVQISAYPDYYAKWEQAAYAWLATLG